MKSEIWSEWLKYESDVGDINAIINVEEKRDKLYIAPHELDERATLFLIDRFKFMNLYPCSSEELKAIGYQDTSNSTNAFHYLNREQIQQQQQQSIQATMQPSWSISTSLANLLTLHSSHSLNNMAQPTPPPPPPPPSKPARSHYKGRFARSHAPPDPNTNAKSLIDLYLNEELVNTLPLDTPTPFSQLNKNRPAFAMPDPNKMHPFKPNMNAFTGLQPVPGGNLFLFPSILCDLLKRLPPPGSFDVSSAFIYILDLKTKLK